MKAKAELLAPAGNMESFYGAIHAGADAVYLGGEKFGARAYADNFSKEELCECICYAHLFGKKVYLTLNTLVKEKEMGEIYAYLEPFYLAGLDGVIIQDMGVFLYVKEQFPGLSLHVSTQMTITGAEGAKELKALGAERIVPARELSLEELRLIKESVDIEIESFVHGAMCYCYSGQCLFSSMLGERSGNRGRCAQPCRLPYRIGGIKEKEAYYLSLKDMCTIEMLPALIEAGIDSFKIEGRMKKAEYAAGVTALYRKYMDLYYEKGKESYRVSKQDMELLQSLYIRSEIGDGYYYRYNGADMISMDKPSYRGSDEKVLAMVRKQYIEKVPYIAVEGKASFCVGRPAYLQLSAEGVTVQAKGTPVQEAVNRPIQEASIRKQLGKFGNTAFSLQKLSVEMESSVFLPVKEINELRRTAVALLKEGIIQKNGLNYPERGKKEPVRLKVREAGEEENRREKKKSEEGIYVLLHTKEQLKAVAELLQNKERVELCPLKAVLVSSDVYEPGKTALQKNKEYEYTETISHALGGMVFAAYPYVMRKKDVMLHDSFEKESLFQGIMVRNLEELALLKHRNYKGFVLTDAGLYIWNRRAEDFYSSEALLTSMSYELNSAEQKELNGEAMCKVVYGRVPMMITANCIRKTRGHCVKNEKSRQAQTKEGFCFLTDRMGKEFPVMTNCRHCYNVIYNSVPLSLHKQVLSKEGKYRLDFTTESAKETKEIIMYFCNIYQKKEGNPPYKDYTTGHEKRMAE